MLGKLKTIKPKFNPPGQEPCAQAQCLYCKRYGSLGNCQGCGAPNVPAYRSVPDIPLRTVIR